MTHAWVIRSGRHGERDAWAMQSACSGGGWAERPRSDAVLDARRQ